jgi:hypothetical protein
VPNVPSLRTTSFPDFSGTGPIGGVVSGVANVATYKVLLYIQKSGQWWLKPAGTTGAPIAADGSFLISGWASDPVADGNFDSLKLFVVPVSFATPNGKWHAM